MPRTSRGSPDPEVVLRGLDSRAVLEKKVLTRLLARRLAESERLEVDPGELADALARFRVSFDLTEDEAFDDWRRSEGVTDAALIAFLRDWVVLDKFQRQHAATSTRWSWTNSASRPRALARALPETMTCRGCDPRSYDVLTTGT